MSPLCAIGRQHQNSYDTDRRTRHETGLKQRDASYLTRCRRNWLRFCFRNNWN
jgi:hypothetical protein